MECTLPGRTYFEIQFSYFLGGPQSLRIDSMGMARLLLLAVLSAAPATANRAPPALPLCPTQPSPDAPTYVQQINLTKCAHGCADMPQCASVTPGGVCIQKCSLPQFPPTGRRLMAWVGGDVDNQATRDTLGGMAAVVHQLRTNPGLIDGLYGFCGQAWKADGTFYVYNVTKNGQCSGTVNQTTTPIPGGADVLAEAKRQSMDFQPVVHLMDPQAAIRSMNESGASSKYITSFVAAAKQHGWKGLNLDWEGSDTTGTREDFFAFMTLMNAFADGFAEHGLVFSTDVQWVTQWTHLNPTDMSELTALLAASRAKLVPMDTYSFSPVGMDCLDYYATRITPERLSVGMSTMIRASGSDPSVLNDAPTTDAFIARFHALNMYGVTDVSMFMMPMAEPFMPWLRKWKNAARGCPRGGSLSAWSNVTCY